jgi:GT2 family glycosyltransferase
MTINEDYAITFACYNQVDYTRRCVDSLLATGVDRARIVAVDNASSDDTRTYLESLNLGRCILNKGNLGCGVAWNQGALAFQSEWTVVMNNDVVVAPGWLGALIACAREHRLKLVCPAMIEGELDYDLNAFAGDAAGRMKHAVRRGDRHAVCMLIHASVWMDIGYFRSVPKLFGYEDTLFFDDLRKAGIAAGLCGASWLHHFGSVTQSAMKLEMKLAQHEGLGARNNKALLNQTWLERKLLKLRRNRRLRAWRDEELAAYGMTLHGERKGGAFRWL